MIDFNPLTAKIFNKRSSTYVCLLATSSNAGGTNYIHTHILLHKVTPNGTYQSSLEPGGVVYRAPASLHMSNNFLFLGIWAGPPLTRPLCKIISGILFDGLICRNRFTTVLSYNQKNHILIKWFKDIKTLANNPQHLLYRVKAKIMLIDKTYICTIYDSIKWTMPT